MGRKLHEILLAPLLADSLSWDNTVPNPALVHIRTDSTDNSRFPGTISPRYGWDR